MNTPIDEYSSYGEDTVTHTARSVFGISYLYPWQRLIIANILDAVSPGRGTADEVREPEADTVFTCKDEDARERGRQIILLPTGAGKSLCFLLPAVLLDGPTLIVYPLLALMADQLRRIRELGLDAVVFRGDQTEEERDESFRRIRAGTRFILANPEVLRSPSLRRKLKDTGIRHVAIDEAHCISEWGDTFRPAYLTLGSLVEELAAPAVSAFTATASPSVLERVRDVLFGGGARVVRGDTDRENIRYSVKHACAKYPALLKELETCARPAVVFCGTRKRAEYTARLAATYFGNNDAIRFYHAGLTRKEKDMVEAWFYPRDDAILASTCAFGMGVDKKNIRTVIHLDPPPTVEAYIQEAGRGGRDGAPSEAILLWGPQDTRRVKELPALSRGRIMETYAEARGCRRQILLTALGSGETACAGCDVCDGTAEHRTNDEDAFRRFIELNKRAYTKKEAADCILGLLSTGNRQKSGCSRWNESDVWLVLRELLNAKRIRERGGFLWRRRLDTA